MTVLSRCHDCGDEHHLEDRRYEDEHLTSLCPACDSPSYESSSKSGAVSKSEKQRIKDALKDIDGVGEKVIKNIANSFSTKAELESATVDELLEIPYVGKVVAKRIVADL